MGGIENKENGKPIDRWLGLFAIVVGIVLYLVPKTEPVIIACCFSIWCLLIYPVIKFWWVEDRKWCQIVAFLALTGVVVYFGLHIKPEKTEELKND